MASISALRAVVEDPSDSGILDFDEARSFGRNGSAKREDLFQVYLRQISGRHLLGREEERELAREIDLRRSRFAARLFESPLALAEVVPILRGLRDGTLIPARHVSLDSPRELRKILPPTLLSLERYLRAGEEGTAAGRQALSERSRQSLLKLGLDIRALIRISRSIAQVSRRYSQMEPGEADYARIRRRTRMTPRGLARWCAEVGRLLARYHERQAVLVRANLRLVISVSRRYKNRGVTFPDLVQEGNLGLIRAADRFQYARGFKFSTYAVWFIRRSILRSLSEHSRPIRLPSHAAEDLQRCRAVLGALTQELGYAPSLAVLAERTGLSAATVQALFRCTRRPISLDEPLSDSDQESFGDMLGDPRIPSPASGLWKDSTRQLIGSLLEKLSAREQEILRLRYGIGGQMPITLEEAGRRFHLSGERVRQVERRAIIKLRQHCPASALRREALEDTSLVSSQVPRSLNLN